MAEDGRVARRTRREVAAYFRACGESAEKEAKQAGCSPRQLYRWERNGDPVFREAFEKAAWAIRHEAWGRAWKRLCDGLESRNESVAIRAASKIVDSIDRDTPTKLEHSTAEDAPLGVVIYLPEPTPLEEDDSNGH